MPDEQNNMWDIPNDQYDSESEDILITPKIAKAFLRNHGLNKELRQKHLVAFGIGTVMTGFFAQWHIGLGTAGPYGVLVAMILAFLIYLIFFSVLTQFSTRYPYAGGPYAYARQGLGTFGGYMAGVASTLQFICGSALVIVVTKNYFSLIYPELPGDYFALAIFIFSVIIHLCGIWYSALVQILLSGSALSVIVLFFLGSSPSVDINNFQNAPIVLNGLHNVLPALSAVMWFYLGLEGITMSAEETRKPQRDVPLGLMNVLGFVTVTSIGIWYFGVGAVNWHLLEKVEFPLLFILSKVQSEDNILLTTFSMISLSVFAASLHGLIYFYSRQVYALSRAGYFPGFFSTMRSNTQTPLIAIIVPGLVSILMSYAGSFRTMSVFTLFSAITVYSLVIISFLQIRKAKPETFIRGNVIRHPFVLWAIIGLLTVTQIALIYHNIFVFKLLLGTWSVAVLYYYFFARKYIRNEAPEESAAILTQNRQRIEFK